MKRPNVLEPHCGPLSGQAGFSMIEILVSATITAVLATSVFYFLSSQNTMGTMGNDSMKAINLGKLKMDSLKVVSYDELSSGSDTLSERYIRTWHISLMVDAAAVPNGRKKIELGVIWPMSGDHSVSFASIKSDDRFKEGTP